MSQNDNKVRAKLNIDIECRRNNLSDDENWKAYSEIVCEQTLFIEILWKKC